MNVTDNPFWILDASPRDSKKVLHDKAENKSFELPENVCRNAESMLLTPAKRIVAELAWFPGISPKKTKDLLAQLKQEACSGKYDFEIFSSLDNLAYANAFAFYLSNISTATFDYPTVKDIVEDFCAAVDGIDSQTTIARINEERITSGFPEIVEDDCFVQEKHNLQHFYKQTLRAFFDHCDSWMIVTVLTELIEDATDYGDDQCDSPLLEDIITDYEVDALHFFDNQEAQILIEMSVLSDQMRTKKPFDDLQKRFAILQNQILLWDKVAQPLQVLCKSKGTEHKRSKALSEKLRELALDAHNKYGYTDLSVAITNLQQTVFAELRMASETAADDKQILQEILSDRKKDADEELARKKKLFYFTKWGSIFKKSIIMDANAIVLNRKHAYKFDDISAILWGITPTKSHKYIVRFICKGQTVTVPVLNDIVYNNVIHRLWLTAGFQILSRFLATLKIGHPIIINTVQIFNDGIELKRYKRLFSEEKHLFPWEDIQISSSNETLTISARNTNFSVCFDYLRDYNVRVVEFLINTVKKNKTAKTLTEAVL